MGRRGTTTKRTKGFRRKNTTIRPPPPILISRSPFLVIKLLLRSVHGSTRSRSTIVCFVFSLLPLSSCVGMRAYAFSLSLSFSFLFKWDILLTRRETANGKIEKENTAEAFRRKQRWPPAQLQRTRSFGYRWSSLLSSGRVSPTS